MEPATMTAYAVSTLVRMYTRSSQNRGLCGMANEIAARLTFVASHFDGERQTKARCAMMHLEDASRTANAAMRSNSLRTANTILVELCNLPPMEAGGKLKLDNRRYIGLGYYGRVQYYTMLDQPQEAARQIYLCAERYPLVAAMTFDGRFFPGVNVGKITARLKLLESGMPKGDIRVQKEWLKLVEELPELLSGLRDYAGRQLKMIEQDMSNKRLIA